MKNLACLSAILLSCLCLHAEEQVATPDPDLPQPLDLGFAESLLSGSPFSRSVNLEESLQLTGVAYIDGRPVATVLNKATKQNILVTEEPNALGWKLTDAVAGADLANTEVHIMVGPEVIAMHYGGAQLSPGADAKGNPTSRLARSGSSKTSSGKFKASSFLGEHGKELYISLSPTARDKFKDLMQNYVEKRPGLTPEQGSEYAHKVFAKIQASDTGAKTAKSSKTKKKQGA